jgi:hypothetical protein
MVLTTERKSLTFTGIEVKDAATGEIEACVATLGVVDNDGDYMRPGCIESGSKVVMSDYGHSWVIGGQRPVGKGAITVTGNKAMFKGRIFMDTEAGQETYKTLKAMGPDQEWSFGYQVVTSSKPSDDERKQGAYRSLDKLKSFEVSPVFMGAGLGTGTTSIKSQADGHTDEVIIGVRIAPSAIPELAKHLESIGAKIAKRDDVSPGTGERQYGDVPFADTTNKKYPIDTEEHIRAAWSYINKGHDADKYSADDVQKIKDRIIAAWKEKIDQDGPPSADEGKETQQSVEAKAANDAAAAEYEKFMRRSRDTR